MNIGFRNMEPVSFEGAIYFHFRSTSTCEYTLEANLVNPELLTYAWVTESSFCGMMDVGLESTYRVALADGTEFPPGLEIVERP